jgi:hypothetical protein
MQQYIPSSSFSCLRRLGCKQRLFPDLLPAPSAAKLQARQPRGGRLPRGCCPQWSLIYPGVLSLLGSGALCRRARTAADRRSRLLFSCRRVLRRASSHHSPLDVPFLPFQYSRILHHYKVSEALFNCFGSLLVLQSAGRARGASSLIHSSLVCLPLSALVCYHLAEGAVVLVRFSCLHLGDTLYSHSLPLGSSLGHQPAHCRRI